jgi:hypothetical protein
MTWMLDGPGGAAVIRAAQAETLENEPVSLRLLLDASATHAAASALRVPAPGSHRARSGRPRVAARRPGPLRHPLPTQPGLATGTTSEVHAPARPARTMTPHPGSFSAGSRDLPQPIALHRSIRRQLKADRDGRVDARSQAVIRTVPGDRDGMALGQDFIPGRPGIAAGQKRTLVPRVAWPGSITVGQGS